MKISRNALKEMVRTFTKEALTEILMEMKLESIIKEAIRDNMPVNQSAHAVPSRREIKPPQDFRKNNQVLEERRREIMRKIGMESSADSADVYSSIFEDTLKSEHPIVTGNDDGNTYSDPGIPEELLERAGIIGKDWSMHLGKMGHK